MLNENMITQDKLAFIEENAPCYLYDKEEIIRRCRSLRAALPQARFLYSIKTNPFLPVVQTVAEQEFGADAASAHEVLLAARTGISKEKIYYSTPGKTLKDIKQVWDKCVIIADSLSELDRLEHYSAEKNALIPVGIRVNPAFTMDGTPAGPGKFGIDEEMLADMLTGNGLPYPHLKITGIHVHLRSQILDTDMLCTYYRNCFSLAERVGKLPGLELAFINFGSGIGTVYDASKENPLSLEKISRTFRDLWKINEGGLRAEFILETGRYIVCNAGSFYTRIVDRKVSRGKTYLIVENGMNGFLRPAIAQLLRANLGQFPQNGQEPLYTSGTQCEFRLLRQDGQRQEGQRQDGQKQEGQRKEGQRQDSQRKDGQRQEGQKQEGQRKDGQRQDSQEDTKTGETRHSEIYDQRSPELSESAATEIYDQRSPELPESAATEIDDQRSPELLESAATEIDDQRSPELSGAYSLERIGRCFSDNNETVDVVGNLCTALDIMAKDIVLPHAEAGDILEVTNAGSYGCTLTPQLFSGHEAPKEFLWPKEEEN